MEQIVQMLLGTIVLCTDSSAALGFVKRKDASRRTRHVDTKVYFMQARAMEPGPRILKVHGVNKLLIASQRLQLLERLIAKLLDFDRCSNLSHIDEGAEDRCAPNHCIWLEHVHEHVSHQHAKMKFVTTRT